MSEQDIQVMVAQNALCPARFNEALNEMDDCRAVGATVGQITYENQSTTIGMDAIICVAQVPQQRTQGIDLTVNIANDVERSVEKGLDERFVQDSPPCRCSPSHRARVFKSAASILSTISCRWLP